MEKEIFKLVLYLLFLFSPSVLVYAFDAVEPKAAIFDFDNDERISLQQYHEWHLNSSGRHEFIALNEADASFGERLILPRRSVEDGAKIAIAAYFPKKYHDKIRFPTKSGKVLIDDFLEEESFVSVTIESVFQDDQLVYVQIVCAQEGSDHSIEIKSIKDAIKIEYSTSLP